MSRPALSAEEVAKAIEHRGPSRVPMMIHFWNGPAAGSSPEKIQALKALQAEYPQDLHVVGVRLPNYWDDLPDPDHIPGYSWMHTPKPSGHTSTAHDSNVAIHDWAMLDDILAAFPDPNTPGILAGQQDSIDRDAHGRYVLATWWFCFYERFWSLRGMENVLCDFYEAPDKVHRFLDALADFYVGIIRRVGRELKGVNGIFTSDDIGMQTGPMFSPAIFREFFKPRYKRLFEAAHEQNLHFWLHACGNIVPFLDELIEVGLDVIHPIQKYTMDERKVAQQFGGRICFWSGMDVQQILPHGTPDDVRREVRFMIDTYDRPDGGCMITAGNGVTDDVSIENLRAFYDEAYNYGVAHRQKSR